MNNRFTEHQFVAILTEGDTGVSIKEICRKHNILNAAFYTWRMTSRDTRPKAVAEGKIIYRAIFEPALQPIQIGHVPYRQHPQGNQCSGQWLLVDSADRCTDDYNTDLPSEECDPESRHA